MTIINAAGIHRRPDSTRTARGGIFPEIIEVFADWASRIEQHQNRYARALDTHVASSVSWLDLGAGTRLHNGWIGLGQDELARRATQLIGCDLVVDHLRESSLLNAAVGARGEALPFRSGTFDVVTANMVLEHLSEPEIVFSEVGRVLRPAGRFVFVTPNRRNPIVAAAHVLLPPAARSWLATKSDGREPEHVFPTFYRANTVPVIQRLAAASGLRVRELETFNSVPFSPRHWPTWYAEIAWIHLLSTRPLRRLTSNLIGVLEKPAPPQ